jgi:putative transposase
MRGDTAVADTTADSKPETDSKLETTDAVDEQLAAQFVEQARSQGLSLIGEGGLLQKLTKMVLENALEGELSDHLGYPAGDPAGRNGGNSRNGHRPKTVLTEIGPVQIEMPRD